MKYLSILIFLFYCLTVLFLSLFDIKDRKYYWYDKNISGEPYFPYHFLSDSRKNLEFLGLYSHPLFVIIKIICYLLLPFIKFYQFCFGFAYFIYFILLFLFSYFLKESFIIKCEFYLDPRSRFIDFLKLILIDAPKCRSFIIFYSILKKIFKREKTKLNYLKLIYNFFIRKLLGISIWNIFVIDLIAMELVSVSNSKELEKKKIIIWWQLICERLVSIFISKINKSVVDADKLKIIKTNDSILFNPFYTIHKREMFSAYTRSSKFASSSNKTCVVKSPNGKEHAVLKTGENESISSGVLFTHSPLKGQSSVKLRSSSNDKRTEHMVMNASFDKKLEKPLSSSLERKTKLNDPERVSGVSNLKKMIDESGYNKNTHYQDSDGFYNDISQAKKPSDNPQLSPNSNERNDKILKANSELIPQKEESKKELIIPKFITDIREMKGDDLLIYQKSVERLHTKIHENRLPLDFSNDNTALNTLMNLKPYSAGETNWHAPFTNIKKKTEKSFSDDEN